MNIETNFKEISKDINKIDFSKIEKKVPEADHSSLCSWIKEVLQPRVQNVEIS